MFLFTKTYGALTFSRQASFKGTFIRYIVSKHFALAPQSPWLRWKSVARLIVMAPISTLNFLSFSKVTAVAANSVQNRK